MYNLKTTRWLYGKVLNHKRDYMVEYKNHTGRVCYIFIRVISTFLKFRYD